MEKVVEKQERRARQGDARLKGGLPVEGPLWPVASADSPVRLALRSGASAARRQGRAGPSPHSFGTKLKIGGSLSVFAYGQSQMRWQPSNSEANCCKVR